MCGCFKGGGTVFRKGSELNFVLSLMQGCSRELIVYTDIIVEVYTTQLSIRKHVSSYVRGVIPASSQVLSDPGGFIRRYRDRWTLTLSPLFLRDLDDGLLHLRVRYLNASYEVEDVLPLVKLC